MVVDLPNRRRQARKPIFFEALGYLSGVVNNNGMIGLAGVLPV